ncbi:hypothetical protein L208DRAFT_1295132 [Tricholoma matsutake]|nr:hypothetical protein L208DRAFT_1295132 [Tricholoma matsutake 945]
MTSEQPQCVSAVSAGQWIADFVLSVCHLSLCFYCSCSYPYQTSLENFISSWTLSLIRHGHFCDVSSDNTGNTQVARQIMADTIKTMLNLPDPNHHVNRTILNIICFHIL